MQYWCLSLGGSGDNQVHLDVNEAGRGKEGLGGGSRRGRGRGVLEGLLKPKLGIVY